MSDNIQVSTPRRAYLRLKHAIENRDGTSYGRIGEEVGMALEAWAEQIEQDITVDGDGLSREQQEAKRVLDQIPADAVLE